jgi:hypothetical protein
MDILLLNKNLETIAAVDAFESFIWTDRYWACGDFELYLPASEEAVNLYQVDYFLYNSDSEHLMIIEDREIETSTENGNHLKIIGRSLESLLSRRIAWNQISLSGYVDGQMEKLVNENIINPSIPERKIKNFVYVKSDDPTVMATKVDSQYTGTGLYDIFNKVCKSKQLGFKVCLNDDNEFALSLYAGKDRSYAQETNPHVVFSPYFDNLSESNYVETNSAGANVALVAGEDSGSNRRTTTVGDTTISGIDRKELYVDARDIQSEEYDDSGNSTTLTDAQYMSKLTERGNEKLSEAKDVKSFEGSAETTNMFVYGKDFFIGDICQIENEYGMLESVRITEFIQSIDSNGTQAYPTFEVVSDKTTEEDT